MVKKYKKRKRSTKSTPNNYENGNRNIYISIITLNVNGLIAPTERHKLAEWIQKQDPYIRCLQLKPISDLKTHID